MPNYGYWSTIGPELGFDEGPRRKSQSKSSSSLEFSQLQKPIPSKEQSPGLFLQKPFLIDTSSIPSKD